MRVILGTAVLTVAAIGGCYALTDEASVRARFESSDRVGAIIVGLLILWLLRAAVRARA